MLRVGVVVVEKTIRLCYPKTSPISKEMEMNLKLKAMRKAKRRKKILRLATPKERKRKREEKEKATTKAKKVKRKRRMKRRREKGLRGAASILRLMNTVAQQSRLLKLLATGNTRISSRISRP